MTHPEVIIVGLGAMGSATARQLASRGRRVMGFDRFHPPHGLGSSGGRSRIIREAYWESPFYVPMVRRSLELWQDLELRTGRHLLRPTGGLVIGPPEGPLIRGALASAEAHDVPITRLTAARIRDRFPFCPADELVCIWEERAGVLAPEDAIAAMLGEAARLGAELRFEEPVLEWRPSVEGIEVRTGMGWFGARQLVVAAGAWMAGPLPRLSLPLRVARQAMFWIRPRSDTARFQAERFPVWLWETGSGVVYYGFPDLGDGPKVARHHGGPSADPETVDRQVAPEEADELLAFLGVGIPELQGMVTDARVCLYTNTPDEHFVVDRHPVHPEVVIASPCSGHGFKFAPALGEALADLLEGRTPRFDLSPFRATRFAEFRT